MRIGAELIGVDVGNWALSTGWLGIYNSAIAQPVYGSSVSSMTFDFVGHWGQYFLFLWLWLAFVIWTALVYSRRARVGKDQYGNGSV